MLCTVYSKVSGKFHLIAVPSTENESMTSTFDRGEISGFSSISPSFASEACVLGEEDGPLELVAREWDN